jgi:hypothetical protein
LGHEHKERNVLGWGVKGRGGGKERVTGQGLKYLYIIYFKYI